MVRPFPGGEMNVPSPYPIQVGGPAHEEKLTNEAGYSPVGSLAPSVHVFFRLQFKGVFV
jgi:hypothetical protein